MFLHLGRFTKQVKEAFKSYCLDIGNINDGLLIYSGFWLVWIKNQYVSNEIKAVVMLLSGTLPKPGEMYTVEKDNEDPQYKIIDDSFYRLITRNDLHNKLIITPIQLTENYDIRLIQGPDRRIHGIRQEFLDMIDKEVVDFDGGEGIPTGPCFGRTITQGVYWYNNFGIVVILPIATKKVEIPAVLSLLQFKEDGSIEKRYLREAFGEAFEEMLAEAALDNDTGGSSRKSADTEPDELSEATDTEGAE